MDPSDLEKLAWADSIGRIKRDARLAQIPPGLQTPKWDVPLCSGKGLARARVDSLGFHRGVSPESSGS